MSLHDRDRPHEAYYDDDGELLFFKKGWGPPSTISFQEITLNGIAYARGTLFHSVRKQKTDQAPDAPRIKNTLLLPAHAIDGLAPLRASRFAFSPDFREETKQILDDREETFTLEDLARNIPKLSENIL